jgi:hypothetical protein
MEKTKENAERSNVEAALLGSHYVVVENPKSKSGTLFVEARIRDDMQDEVDTAKVYI